MLTNIYQSPKNCYNYHTLIKNPVSILLNLNMEFLANLEFQVFLCNAMSSVSNKKE